MNTWISIEVADGHKLGAFQALPQGHCLGGLVVLQEIFGVNKHIQNCAATWAQKGWMAVAPCLFDRYQPGLELGYAPADIQVGMNLVKRENAIPNALTDIAATVRYLSDQLPGKKIGVLGYCYGGTLAWLSAGNLPVAAAVAYYGGYIAQSLSVIPKCPVMMHFGRLDQHIPTTDVERIGKSHPAAQIFVYEADHGFNCDQRASFNPEAAALAQQRSSDFLHTHLSAK